MPDGSAQVVVVGADGIVDHEVRRADGSWTGFQPLAGLNGQLAAGSAVSIGGMPDGSAQVLVVGTDGVIDHEVRDANGSWTGFQPLSGMTGQPAQGSQVGIAG